MSGCPRTPQEEMDIRLQQARGHKAKYRGQPFDVYRLSADTPALGILSGAPIATVNAIVERTTSRKLLENATFDLVTAIATVDNRPLRIGDILIESGYRSDGGVWCFVQYRALQETIFLRCEQKATITRPNTAGGELEEQPLSGSVVAGGYLGTTDASEQALTLSVGRYAFVPPGPIACSVPIGMQQTARVRDSAVQAGQLGTEIPLGQVVVYVPELPGVKLQERDVVDIGGTNGRYVVRKGLSSGTMGLQGYIAICESLPG